MDGGGNGAGSRPAQAQDTWLVYASSGEYPVAAGHAALAAVMFIIDHPDDYIAAVVSADMEPPLAVADMEPLAEDIAGRAATGAELARIAAAIPHSTIPDALAAVTDGCLANGPDGTGQPAPEGRARRSGMRLKRYVITVEPLEEEDELDPADLDAFRTRLEDAVSMASDGLLGRAELTDPGRKTCPCGEAWAGEPGHGTAGED
jgi:hypothetical protein